MSYPTSEPVTATPATAPQSLRNAVRLMYLGALLALVGIIIGVTTRNAVLDAARRELVERGDTPADVDNAMNMASGVFTGTVIVGGIVSALLWLWMAWANGKGRKWARIVATILFVINTVGVISAVVTQQTGAAHLWLSIATWLVGLAAIYFLWRKDSSAYFDQMSLRT